MDEVVIDTNVLVHASNGGDVHYQPSVAFLEDFVAGGAAMLIDEGYDEEPTKNESRIYREYHQFLKPGMYGFYVLAALGNFGRIVERPQYPDLITKAEISALVHDSGDRVFLGVSAGSSSRVLISHDQVDMPLSLRPRLKGKIGVCVVPASGLNKSCAVCGKTHSL